MGKEVRLGKTSYHSIVESVVKSPPTCTASLDPLRFVIKRPGEHKTFLPVNSKVCMIPEQYLSMELILFLYLFIYLLTHSHNNDSLH